MKDDRRCELAAEFTMYFAIMIRAMDAIFRKEMESREITWPQFAMIKLLEARGPMTVTEISGALLVAAPTASRMIEGLRAKGLLDKVKDGTDMRVSRAALTARGRRLASKLTDMRDEVMLKVFSDDRTEDLEAAVEQMRRFSAKLREEACVRTRKGVTDE